MREYNVLVSAIRISTGEKKSTTVTVEACNGSEANWKALDEAKVLYPASEFRNHTAA